MPHFTFAFALSDHKNGGLRISLRQMPGLFYYRIQDYRTLSIQERGRRTPYQFFTNPSIERVFRDFSSVKMYLTRASPDF